MPRYRVIALCIALDVAERASNGSQPEAVDPGWVRAQALYWWPAGFQDDASLEVLRHHPGRDGRTGRLKEDD